jgi:hypothetical protein
MEGYGAWNEPLSAQIPGNREFIALYQGIQIPVLPLICWNLLLHGPQTAKITLNIRRDAATRSGKENCLSLLSLQLDRPQGAKSSALSE